MENPLRKVHVKYMIMTRKLPISVHAFSMHFYRVFEMGHRGYLRLSIPVLTCRFHGVESSANTNSFLIYRILNFVDSKFSILDNYFSRGLSTIDFSLSLLDYGKLNNRYVLRKMMTTRQHAVTVKMVEVKAIHLQTMKVADQMEVALMVNRTKRKVKEWN